MELQRIDLTEIVFRKRNRKYGAYHLRRVYVTHTRNALLIALFGCGLLLAAPFGVQAVRSLLGADAYLEAAAPIPDESVAVLETPPPMEEEAPLPELPEMPAAPPPPQRSAIQYTEPDPVPDEQAQPDADVVASNEAISIDADLGKLDVEGDPGGEPNFLDFSNVGDGKGTGGRTELGAGAEAKSNIPDHTTYVPVEVQPKVVNLDRIDKDIVYPELLKTIGVEGKVILRILIDERGNYMQHIVLKSPHPLMQKEAEEHLHKLKFTPAIQANKPIKFWVNVPIDFRLQD